MFRTLGVVLTSFAIASPNLLQQTPPGDCEVRTSRDTVTNDTLTTLTLMLRGPKGPLPINLVITTRRKAPPRKDPPLVTMSFNMGLYAGKINLDRPHVLFVIDRNQELQTQMSYNLETQGSVRALSQVNVDSDLGTLTKLGKAHSIDGRVFGAEFVLTDRQVTALRSFSERTTAAGK